MSNDVVIKETQEITEHGKETRDLAQQVADLDEEDQKEVEFRDVSPGRVRLTIWNAETGEPCEIPKYMVGNRQTGALSIRALDGKGYMFTDRFSEAPAYELGKVKCFLHPESPERELLNAIGLTGVKCMSAHLASNFSERTHGRNRHSQERQAYDEEVARRERAKSDQRQEEQTGAILKLAGGKAKPVAAQVATTEPEAQAEKPKRKRGKKGATNARS